MTARKPSLRSVAPGETAPRPVPTTVAEAAEFGTRLDELKLMRLVIARAIDSADTSARDLAALSRRQIEISKDIEALVAKEREEATHAGEVEDGKFDAAAI